MAAILIPGTYLIPGVGEIVITAGLAILLGKAAVELGTEVYKKVEEGLTIHFAKEAEKAKKEVPDRLKDSNGNVSKNSKFLHSINISFSSYLIS